CGAFWAPRGLESPTANPMKDAKPARVSKVENIHDGVFTTTSVTTFHKANLAPLFESLRAQAGLTRGWGDCYGHMLVATGRAEAMVDPQMNAWDCAALKPIVEEAGGTFTDLKGSPTIHGGNALSTNGKVFQQVMGIIRAAK
ncbi:MAG: hypothetical protein HUU29_00735, partial [Planctomycetaceae bacterium]|nr:hypothetical protein [Planctomycetaceae bacterium]